MIACFNLENAHLFPQLLANQHRFRYQQFIQRVKWNVPQYKQMEFDQFDTPATFYLVWLGSQKRIGGMMRLLSTTQPYMLQTVWPGWVNPAQLPRTSAIWELTRFAVDQRLPKPLRERALGELLVAALAFAQTHHIQQYLVVSPYWLLQRLARWLNFTVTPLLNLSKCRHDALFPALIPLSCQLMKRVRDLFRLEENPLKMLPIPSEAL